MILRLFCEEIFFDWSFLLEVIAKNYLYNQSSSKAANSQRHLGGYLGNFKKKKILSDLHEILGIASFDNSMTFLFGDIFLFELSF